MTYLYDSKGIINKWPKGGIGRLADKKTYKTIEYEVLFNHYKTLLHGYSHKARSVVDLKFTHEGYPITLYC